MNNLLNFDPDFEDFLNKYDLAVLAEEDYEAIYNEYIISKEQGDIK